MITRAGAPGSSGRRRLRPDEWYPAGDPVARARFVTLASGHRVRVVEAGDPSAPPVLLLHGWACSAYSFRFTLPALAAAGLHATAVDLLGHGQSDKPLAAEHYSADALTRQVAHLLDALDLGPVSIVGHSLGGGVALRLAASHPERVDRVAVVSPANASAIPILRVARWLSPPAVAPLLPRLATRWLFGLVLRSVQGGNHRRYTARDVDEYWAPTQSPDFVRALRLLVHEYDWSPLAPDTLRTLHQPLLAILGDLDRLTPAADIEPWLCNGYGGPVRVHRISAGHTVQEEAPAAVNAALVDFLAPPGRLERGEARARGARSAAGGGSGLDEPLDSDS